MTTKVQPIRTSTDYQPAWGPVLPAQLVRIPPRPVDTSSSEIAASSSVVSSLANREVSLRVNPFRIYTGGVAPETRP